MFCNKQLLLFYHNIHSKNREQSLQPLTASITDFNKDVRSVSIIWNRLDAVDAVAPAGYRIAVVAICPKWKTL